MSKRRVIKARFFRNGVQEGEITASYATDMTDEQIRKAMLRSYKHCLREGREQPEPPDDKPAHPEHVEHLYSVLGLLNPEMTMDLDYPAEGNGDEPVEEDEDE